MDAPYGRLQNAQKKKLDGNHARKLRAILNKSWKQQLYGYLPPISKPMQVKLTRHAAHCLRSKDELISDVRLCTSTHGHTSVGQPIRFYLHQLCADTGCSQENLPGQWRIGTDGERESVWKYVLSARLDDDDIHIQYTKRKKIFCLSFHYILYYHAGHIPKLLSIFIGLIRVFSIYSYW